MSFKAFIKNLLAFLKDLFGDKKETVQPSTTTQTIVLDPSKCMPEGVLDRVAGDHEGEERTRIRAHVRGQEARGIYNYEFSTSRWYYKIHEGQVKKSSTDPELMKINRI